MYQRLLLMLAVLCIAGTSMAQNVMTPTDPCYKYDKTKAIGTDPTNPAIPAVNTIAKWVHDPTQNNPGRQSTGPNPDTIGSHGFDQSTYKCYIWNSTAFRLRFPNNYDPAKKYPMVLFLHGAGEAASLAKANNATPTGGTINRENQDQLYWGAQLFEQRMNSNEWNGFLLFPQLTVGSAEWDATHNIPPVNNILDTLTKYNGLDPDRITVMGLSAGGLGTVTYAETFPTRIAAVVASCPEQISGQTGHVAPFFQIPFWVGCGGVDGGGNNPTPNDIIAFRNSFTDPGGNMYLDYYPNQGHVMWSIQWNKIDVHGNHILSNYWNNAHKAQPLLYFQKNQFCEGSTISAKMEITPGFAAYEWQKDNATVGTTYSYTATAAGTYRVHFKRTPDAQWSDWTPNPIVISTTKCTTADTAYVEHFDGQVAYIARLGDGSGSNSSYQLGNYPCQNGIFTNASESFTQDGAGHQAGRFMFNSTTNLAGCAYHVNDQVWHNTGTVQTFTDYMLSFSMANQQNFYDGNTGLPPASLSVVINGTTLTPAGGVKAQGIGTTSWKKYTYLWNSGNAPNNFADIGIINNTLDYRWNDFALDEISLVKYKTPPMPGFAYKNVTLWAKANSIVENNDSTPVGLWTNSDLNGDNLQQSSPGSLPVLKNNAADNINFNPVVKFSGANGQFMQAPAGFSGTTAHTAVTAYIVAKFNTLAQDEKTILLEQQASNNFIRVALGAGGKLSWTTGSNYFLNGGTLDNTIVTPASSIEVNTPSVWSFSKDNNNTANGNKQDIRKNGVVIATGTHTFTFTGNNSAFGLSAGGQFFDGNIAEVIYLLDSTITPLRQNQIESYLALKYGNTLGTAASPISYTASDGTTIFWTGNTKYQNDVFGIGKDSLSALLQTKSNSANSGSGDGTGQSAKGNLVLSTSTDLLDKRFLVIGNDAGSLSQHVIASGEANALAVGSTRIIRNWKVNNTGAVGAVSISFDTTGLNKQAGVAVNSYALMISNSGDDTYQGTLSFITATGISANKIMFPVVTFANGAVFTLITNNLNVALPAVWLGFTAEAVNGNGVLNWKTSDEINVDRYTVEHSFNGVSFSAIGTVAANNNTGVNNYNYTDAGLAAGNHYYRIRRTDKDGKSEYSDIKTIKIVTAGANVQIRPNPVAGSTLIVGVSVQQSSKTSLQVMAVDGKIMMQQNVTLTTGNNIVNINIGSVPPGIYLLRVQLNDGIVIKKFIRER